MAKKRPALPKHARRWDAVFLGSALPGLVSAARLAVAGQRILIIEEASAAEMAPVVRERKGMYRKELEGWRRKLAGEHLLGVLDGRVQVDAPVCLSHQPFQRAVRPLLAEITGDGLLQFFGSDIGFSPSLEKYDLP